MKRTRMLVGLSLVMVLMLSLMVPAFAEASSYYRCNGNSGNTYRSSSHSYGTGNCDIMIRQSYCTLYVGNVPQGTAYHTHDHVRYHTQSGCPGGTVTICTHGSNH